jgi:6,7-dimethyl-8-ribityllumazine synthase
MSAKPPHLLLVEALFYEHLAADLRRGAERAVAEAGATSEVISVPGTFEVPAAIALAARGGASYDGYVALGCVIRGETTHYDHICAETARSLQELMVRDGLAIGYGILTCENEAQALVRATPGDADRNGRDKGGEATRACLALVELKRRFQGQAS